MNLSGFYKKTPEERLEIVKKIANLTEEECEILRNTGSLSMEIADRMVENVIGAQHLPLGIATNFIINGREVLIPMAIEEPSVIAAASYAAKLARPTGFEAESDDPIMIGQIQLVDVENVEEVKETIFNNKERIKKIVNERDPTLIKFGGGFRDLDVKIINTEKGKMVVVYLYIDVRDAMGANAINTMCEAVSPLLEELTGGKARLRIISNLADRRVARAKAVWTKEKLEESTNGSMTGEEVVDAIIDAYLFAKNDEYRCATHNKGIMNGIDALAIATGNDFRALEAGAHCYAALGGYHPLTRYEKDKNGNLVGYIELPIAFGIVGGATKTNPIARIALKILGVKSAQELAEVAACLGLAQNFAALRALATEGIQKGHMRLHAKNIAVMAGAEGNEIDEVAKRMIEENNISVNRAEEILKEIKNNSSTKSI